MTIPQGTLVYLRTSEGIESKHAKDGEPLQFTVIQDVAVGGVLAIPRGATVHGVVTESKNVGAGQLGGSSVLGLKLVSLDLGGRSYPIDSDEFRVKSPNKAGETVSNAVGAGLIGTIIGGAVGRGAGCAIGAGAGVAAGTAASAATPGPRAWIPAEALVKFHPRRSCDRRSSGPAGSGAAGRGAVSRRRTEPLPARTVWIALLRLRSISLWIPGCLLPALLCSGRVLFLAVKQGTRERETGTLQSGCPLCL